MEPTSSAPKAVAIRRASRDRADHLKFTILPDSEDTEDGVESVEKGPGRKDIPRAGQGG